MLGFYRNLAKLTRTASKIVGKKGTDLPGKVLRKVNDNVLTKLASDFDEIVFVTGTNGKTTTSNLIGHTLRCAGKNFINNFFRDQIDRFGEIDTLIATIGEQWEGKNIQLILNSDDPFVTRLSKYGEDNIYFGIAKDAYQFSDFGISESKFCPNCGMELIYDHVHYSQLGFYHCSKCDFKHQDVKYEVTNATVEPFINMTINEDTLIETKLAGDYNIYNLLAAYSLLKELGLQDEKIKYGLESYTATNGRMQSISLAGGSTVLLNLAKNPAGLNASLAIANSIKEEINYLLVLNDNGADGIDISWIWDTDFDILNGQKINNIVCSGKRAKELALRLKYTGINANVVVLESISEAVEKLKSYKEKYAIAIPNYTALVETQKELEK